MSTPASHLASSGRVKSVGYVERALETTLAHDLMRPHFQSHQENFLLLAFDAFHRLIHSQEALGMSDELCVIPQRCWRELLQANVSSVIMAHNHPSGIAWPSSIDRQTTIKAVMMLEILGITLLDHLIFVDHGHYSFRLAGLL